MDPFPPFWSLLLYRRLSEKCVCNWEPPFLWPNVWRSFTIIVRVTNSTDPFPSFLTSLSGPRPLFPPSFAGTNRLLLSLHIYCPSSDHRVLDRPSGLLTFLLPLSPFPCSISPSAPLSLSPQTPFSSWLCHRHQSPTEETQDLLLLLAGGLSLGDHTEKKKIPQTIPVRFGLLAWIAGGDSGLR